MLQIKLIYPRLTQKDERFVESSVTRTYPSIAKQQLCPAGKASQTGTQLAVVSDMIKSSK